MPTFLEIEEREALDKLLSDANFSLEPGERERAQADVIQFLREIEKLSVNQSEGGVRVIIHGKHISLKTVLWEIVAGSLALVPKALDPSGISQTVGAVAFGSSLLKLKDKITSLSQFEILVCHAVVRLTQEKEIAAKRSSSQARVQKK